MNNNAENELISISGKCSWLAESDRERLTAVFQSNSACFLDIVKAAGIRPTTDLRFADLSGVDFAHSDIRGFDFTGANLSNTRWNGATWDGTTILENACLDGSTGILPLVDKETDNTALEGIFNSATEGVVVTDAAERVCYANAAYFALIGATVDVNDAHPSRVFVNDPDVSEAIFRLSKAAREGGRLREEVRVPGLEGKPSRWLRLQIRPLNANAREARLTLWTVADVTRDRASQENVFQELQHAIDYLDHAPAGFFSVDAGGDIVYLNATLAAWLDHDLEQVGAGSLKLTDIVAGEGAALLTTLSAVPGEVKTEVLDLDLKTRGGKPLPVRLFHKVAFGADGAAGASRTLVLNRAHDDGTDPQRAAEVRFMRFFQNTPMAIATVDKAGRIARSNARFASAFEGMLKGDERSILSVVAERDRPALESAIRKAGEGQRDIAPVEAALAGSSERWANFFVSAVEEEDRDGEAAIVYALETTGQRTL